MRSATGSRLQPATLADLEALPDGTKGELVDGVLYAMTRPRGPHQSVVGSIVSDLQPPYQRGRGGPGGWWILPEPGLCPSPAHRRSRRTSRAGIAAACPRSPSTAPSTWYYARVGVAWMWLVDLESQQGSAEVAEYRHDP